MSDDQPVLSVSALRVLNLSPVSLAVRAGECVSLRGPSGSGKSLLLRAIADLDAVQGSVSIKGAERNSMPATQWRRQVRYFASESGWWSPRVGAHFTQAPDLPDLLSAFGLPGDCMDWTIDRASTGEKQRLSLVRGLADHPKVLLLDEPTSALDTRTARKAEKFILARLEKEGAAAIVVTHDAAQAKRMASRHYAIRNGSVAEVAS